MILLLFSVLCCFIIYSIFYYIFCYKKSKTYSQLISSIASDNDTIPTSVTLKQENNKTYKVLEYEDGKWKINYKDDPILFDGSKFRPTEHGNITYKTDGFTVQGSEMEFICPNPYTWNNNTKQCELKKLCKDSEKILKGITKDYFYYYNNKINLKTLQNKSYHSRIYIACPEDEIKICGDNYIYNQNETNPIDSNPCIPYDICQDKMNGDKHIFDFKKELKDNEFYICQNGESIKQSCGKNKFDEFSMGCISIACKYGDLKPNNENSYFKCIDGVYRLQECKFGVDKTKTACLDDPCLNYNNIMTPMPDELGGYLKIDICNNGKIFKKELNDKSTYKIIIKEKNFIFYNSQLNKDGTEEKRNLNITCTYKYDESVSNIIEVVNKDKILYKVDDKNRILDNINYTLDKTFGILNNDIYIISLKDQTFKSGFFPHSLIYTTSTIPIALYYKDYNIIFKKDTDKDFTTIPIKDDLIADLDITIIKFDFGMNEPGGIYNLGALKEYNNKVTCTTLIDFLYLYIKADALKSDKYKSLFDSQNYFDKLSSEELFNFEKTNYSFTKNINDGYSVETTEILKKN